MRFQRAAGQPQVEDPDARVFPASDAATAFHLKRFLDLGIAPEDMLRVVRVLAEGLSHAAEEMRSAALGAVLHPGVSELQIARGSEALLGGAAPLLGPVIQDMLLLQLRQALQSEAVTAGERALGMPIPGARMIGAAFADLVGFTRLGEELPPEDLEQLADRLAGLAREVVAAPVKLIKTIGDAVMFVSADTAALLDAVLTLVDAAEADGSLPRLRVGVAYGSAVSRAGDWFGSPVNLASRVTSAARPGAVLVAESAYAEIGDDPRMPAPSGSRTSPETSRCTGRDGPNCPIGASTRAQRLRSTAMPPATRAATSRTIAQPGLTSHQTNPVAIRTGDTANSAIPGC